MDLEEALLGVGELTGEVTTEEVLEEISQKKMAVATYLREARLLGVEKRIINLGLPKNLSFHKESLEHREYKQFVEDVLMSKLNKKIGIKYFLIDEVSKQVQASTSKEAINKIINAFDGEVLT